MSRPVLWSRDALDDLKSQIARIAAENPAAARRVADRISATCAALGDRPIGRVGRIAGTYEKSVVGLPFIVAYALGLRAGAETVSILRVIHSARDWPAGSWPKERR